MRNRLHRTNNFGHAFRRLAPLVLMLLILGPVSPLPQAKASWVGAPISPAQPASAGATHIASAGNVNPVANLTYASANQKDDHSSQAVSMSQVSTTTGSTQFTYNLDRQLTQIVQPGGVTVTFGYDSAG